MRSVGTNQIHTEGRRDEGQGKDGHVTGWGVHKPGNSRTAHTPDARSSKEHFSPGDFRGDKALETP